MRIAVDGRALRPGTARARGVASYLRCLLEELRRAFPEDDYELVDPGRLGLATAALAGRPRLDRLAHGCDAAWVPAPGPVAISPDVPFVLTVHDLSFEHRPGDFSRYDRAWLRIARPARLALRAERVLCVSEATRQAVVDEWGIEPGRTRTVLPGPGRPPGASRESLPGLPDEFVLSVGALEPRKQPSLLVEAHRQARDAGLRAGLVFAGDGPLRAYVERSDAVVLGHVPDAVLDVLYERALVVSCASREEGFGFTPLEALARGVPAIVTDLPVFNETVGEGALRVPPGDTAALVDVLLRLEREPGLRDRLAECGPAAVAHLSWEGAARATRAAFAEAAR